MNAKKTIIFLLLVLLSTMVVGQTKTHINKPGKYQIEYLHDWAIQESGTQTTLFAPIENAWDNRYENLGISISSASGMTLDECYKIFITDGLPNEFDEYQTIQEGSQEINGLKFRWIECSFKQEDGMKVVNLIYTAVKNDKIYILIGYCSAKKYPQYKDKFLIVINSFILK